MFHDLVDQDQRIQTDDDPATALGCCSGPCRTSNRTVVHRWSAQPEHRLSEASPSAPSTFMQEFVPLVPKLANSCRSRGPTGHVGDHAQSNRDAPESIGLRRLLNKLIPQSQFFGLRRNRAMPRCARALHLLTRKAPDRRLVDAAHLPPDGQEPSHTTQLRCFGGVGFANTFKAFFSALLRVLPRRKCLVGEHGRSLSRTR